MLDDDHRVADVAELLERVDEPAVVALVEPIDGSSRMYSDADELRADLRREPDPLRLAARQRLGRDRAEVAEADVSRNISRSRTSL